MTDVPPDTSTDNAPAPASWTRVAAGATDLTLEENWLFRLRRERFQSRVSGRVHDFYVMYLADAVYAIALTEDDRMVLVRQFRAASMHDSLEAPGGLLEPGEDPREAGARELLEETGYAGDAAVLLGTLWSNPSIMTSRTTTIVIRNARRVAEPKLDHAEEVAVELVSVSEIPRLIREGRIDHALCVAGLLWWLQAGDEGSVRS
jgi:8-oxo-dGTP pyrophosphatase MutT (NUDIX family)